ncbi:hypothetical protein V1264_016725 [Littorina saxatilis]|uniref:Uncharacterized protein n=1 Tax=Littorina saxatilis TaxID=31220 RepID=A0AAN9BFP6_9CAEN
MADSANVESSIPAYDSQESNRHIDGSCHTFRFQGNWNCNTFSSFLTRPFLQKHRSSGGKTQSSRRL